MFPSDEAAVVALAPDAGSAKNGRDLVLKKKFLTLHHAEGVLLFGTCQGSGSQPYACSVDFQRPEQPTYRCTCPSRKFPCKHGLGLLFAYVMKKPFTEAAIPADLAEKRQKLAAKTAETTSPSPTSGAEAAKSKKPKTVNKAALQKKIQTQLEGIDKLERLTHDAVRLGLGNMNPKLASQMQEQAKQLGDTYLPGAQAALVRYTQLFEDRPASGGEQESILTEAFEQLVRLQAMIKHGRAYLKARLADDQLALPTDTNIAAWLGHAWQLTELKALGLTATGGELLQLAFHMKNDEARKQFVDTGIWCNLPTGQIVCTYQFRPHQAAKMIKAEDSTSQIVQVEELYVYPGAVNPRVRWERHTSRPPTAADFARAKEGCQQPFAAVLKEMKNLLKNPLNEREPLALVRYQRLGQVAERDVIEDAAGERILLSDDGFTEEPKTCSTLSWLPAEAYQDQLMLLRFRHDLDRSKLLAKPISIITTDRVIRLAY